MVLTFTELYIEFCVCALECKTQNCCVHLHSLLYLVD